MTSSRSLRSVVGPLLLVAPALAACGGGSPPAVDPTASTTDATGVKNAAADAGVASPTTDAKAPSTEMVKVDVTRSDFNRLAAELALPLFWSEDTNKNGAVDAAEVAVYWGLEPGTTTASYVDRDAFTTRALDAIARIQKRSKEPATPDGLDAKESARRQAVLKELAQGRVTLVATDLSQATAEEKRFVGLVLQAAEQIESA